MNVPDILAMWTPSVPELVIIMIIALLLFGKRLPEVARNLGKGVVEFKKGLKGVEDDFDDAANYQPPRPQSQPLPYGGEGAPRDSATSAPPAGVAPSSGAADQRP